MKADFFLGGGEDVWKDGWRLAYGLLLDDVSLLCDLASKIVMHSRVVTASLILRIFIYL